MDGSFNFSRGGEVNLTLANDAPGIGVRGQRVNLVLTPSDVHQPQELDTYLAGYKNYTYRADEASKVFLVDHDTDYIRTMSANNVFRLAKVKTSLNAAIPEIDPASSTDTYTVADRMMGGYVPDVTADNAMPHYKLEMVTASLVKNVVALDREYDVWTMLSATANWNANNHTTLGATAAWGTSTGPGSASAPLKNLEARIVASSAPVTDIFFNQQVAFSFLSHPDVREHMRSTIGDAGSRQITGTLQVADASTPQIDFMIPGLPPFHVVCAKYLVESTGLLTYVLGNHTVLLTSPSGIASDGMQIATTTTFRRKGRSGTGWQTRKFRIENRGNGGNMVVVNMADIAKMTGNDCGGLIKDCYQ